MSDHDVIVVGVGGAGSATVYELARRGVDVLGLEQFDVPHARGSSHGSTRIIRLTQPEHPSYVPLVRRAYERWRDLERETGRELLHTTGSVHAGAESTDIVPDAVEACEANDVPYELLDASELNERFPGYGLPEGEGFSGVYQPDGGFVDCERAVVAHVEAAQAAGATVRAREAVLDWRETGDGVRVTTNKGQYRADELVVTAGAWAGKLVPELDGHLFPARRVMAWLQPEEPAAFAPDSFPVFSLRSEAWNGYGFPVYDTPGFKFGRGPDVPKPVDPDELDQEPTQAEEELLRRFADRYFPDGAGPTMRLETCMVTDSTDRHFLLGRLPDRPVTVAAGFTGHGFKFASVVGEATADFALDGDTDLPVDVHRLSRFL
jgi:sarcosine oxidase